MGYGRNSRIIRDAYQGNADAQERIALRQRIADLEAKVEWLKKEIRAIAVFADCATATALLRLIEQKGDEA